MSSLVALFLLANTALVDPSPAPAAVEPTDPAISSPALPQRGPYLVATAGYGVVPVGDGDWMHLAPISIEFGFHESNAEVGLAVEYGTTTGATCAHCDGWRWRVGFNGRGHLRPKKTVDPWVGVGIAYERLSVPGQSALLRNWGGIDLPRVSVGLDLHLVPGLLLAPYVSASLAWYDPEAPAWTQMSYQVSCDMGVRLGYAF
jgi:hypothetical protein